MACNARKIATHRLLAAFATNQVSLGQQLSQSGVILKKMRVEIL